MGKTESIWRFGDFSCINSWSRTRYRTTEKTEIFRRSEYINPIASGTYYWINRPRQRYDYESSLTDAYNNLLDRITWKQYEEWKEDIDLIKDAIIKMENYKGTPDHSW